MVFPFSSLHIIQSIDVGGPGCSGLLGFFSEQGPFRPNADMSLSFNPEAWNKVISPFPPGISTVLDLQYGFY
jgi:hypothetical protein